MSELEEFVEKPKAEVLLKAAEAMRPTAVSAEIEALETAGTQLAGAHVLSSLRLGQVLRRVLSGLGAAWTPVSIFLGMVRSAAFAHLSQDVLWERIASLHEALVFYRKYAEQLVASAESALNEAQGYVWSLGDSAWHEASERLRLHSEALGELERLGTRIKTELSLLPKLREELRKQTASIPAQKAASEIELMELGEVAEFTASLNKVRSMVRRME